jgi:hypothetical protein
MVAAAEWRVAEAVADLAVAAQAAIPVLAGCWDRAI